MLSNKTVRILSLDGGGTRGFIQSYFLEKFCLKAGITKLANYFDLIAGASVGGINAVAFADGLSPESMCSFFREKTPWIFTIRSATDLLSDKAEEPSNKPNAIQKAYMLGVSDPFYKSVSPNSNYGDARLKKEIQNIFENRILTSINTPVLLTAHNYSKQHPLVFTNISMSAVPETFRKQKIVDVLMGTSAAPIYFPSYNIHLSADPEEPDDKIIDGGLFQNNPVSLALSTAISLYPSAKRYCILSIGTGLGSIRTKTLSEEPSPSEASIAKYLNLLDIVISNAEHSNDLCFKALHDLAFDTNFFYYRFNINLDPNRDCELDTSTSDFFDYLEQTVDEKILEDDYELGQFISRFVDIDGSEMNSDIRGIQTNTSTPQNG